MASYSAADLAARARELFPAIEETGDPAQASEVMGLLSRAVELDPNARDVPLWCHWLGLACARLAEAGWVGWDDAVAWLRGALAGPAHPAVDPDEVTFDLVWTMVRRCLTGADLADFDRLALELDGLSRPSAASPAAVAVDFYRAVARLGRLESRDDQADRLQACALLDAVLADVPDGWPFLPEALLSYAEICADEERHDVGLAAVARARTLPESSDGDADPDGPALGDELAEQLDLIEAQLLEGRLLQADDSVDSDSGDNDALVAVLARIVVRADPTPYALRRYGELLCVRGDRTDSPGDLALGARWLTAALDAGTGDAAWTWYLLGMAHQRRAELLGDPDLFDAAAECFRAVLERPDVPVAEEVDQEEVTASLAVVLVERYFAVPGVDAVNSLVEAIDRVPRRPAGSLGAVALDFYAAVARLIRVELVPERAGVDQADAMARLDAALPHVPDDWPLLTGALLNYAGWCGRTERIDDGLATIARARRVAPPDGHPEQVDLLAIDQLEAALRAVQGRDPVALEAFLGRLAQDAAGAGGANPGTVEFLTGLQIVLHASQSGSHEDLREGLRQLETALEAGFEPAAVGWYLVGVIGAEMAGSTGDTRMRETAAECLQKALEGGLTSLEPTLATIAHRHLAVAIAARLKPSGYPDVVVGEAAAELEAAWPLLAGGRSGATARAELGAALVPLLMPVMVRDLDFDVARLDELEAALQAHPAPPAHWPTLLGTFVLVRDMVAALVRKGPSGVPAYSESRARDAFAGGPIPDQLVPFVAYQEMLRAHATGQRARMQDALGLVSHLDSPLARLIAGLAEGQLAAWDGKDPTAAMNSLAEAIEGYGTDDPAARVLRDDMLPLVRLLAMMSRARAGGRVSPRDYVRLIPSLMRGGMDLARGRAGHGDRARQGQAADPLTSALSGALPLIQAALASSIPFYPASARREILDQAARFAGTSDPAAIALGNWQIADETGDPQAVEQAIIWADRALNAMDGPQDKDWAWLALIAGEARRRRGATGDRERSRKLGLSALRCHTRRVWLQSGTADALAAAREAIDDALTVADWCAEDRTADDLILALDAGRGLALHAAVTTRSAAERLAGLGETKLAADWVNAGGDERVDVGLSLKVQSELRRKVLDTLAAGPRDLLEPPRPNQIRAALHEHGSDALVYLVPGRTLEGGRKRPGRAVVVPARETAPLQVLELPGLAIGPGTPLEHYADKYQARHRRDQTESEAQAAFEPWRAELSALTGWAGREVCADLLEATESWANDPACPRLVLVPIGPLALVPWHAALCDDGRGARMPLAARAVVSYIPSARLLCQAVSAPPVTDGGALIVGNPAGSDSLRGAALEARAVREAFYPDATFYGRATDGQAQPERGGTPAEVLAWLRGHPAGRELVHLACHGQAEPADPTRSHLMLADGPLATSELLAQRPAEATPVERVFLCACSSNVSGLDYDEAFSVATAFLATGARTVFGSMWDVPDQLTSRIVFAVHHYLAEGHSPADAMHRAQLWSLNPDREVLSTMPDELLAAQTGASDDPAGWAGLVHLGA